MKILYIIGSGLSKAENDELPISNDFLEKMYPKLNAKEKEAICTQLHSMLNNKEYTKEDCKNFEKIYSYSIMKSKNLEHIEKAQNAHRNEERQAAQKAILKGMYLLLKPTESSKIKLHKRFLEEKVRNGDVIVTTNYDIFLDRAIVARHNSINYGLGKSKIVFMGKQEKEKRKKRKHNSKAPMLLKLHGSFNWCKAGEDLGVGSGEPTEEKVVIKRSLHDLPSNNKGSSQEKAELLNKVGVLHEFIDIESLKEVGGGFVNPGIHKKPETQSYPFRCIWERFKERLTVCDGVIIIGSPVMSQDVTTDPHLKKILEKTEKRFFEQTSRKEKLGAWLSSSREDDEKQLENAPTFKDVSIVEKMLRKAKGTIKICDLEEMLPGENAQLRIKRVLDYFQESGKVLITTKGLVWIYRPPAEIEKLKMGGLGI